MHFPGLAIKNHDSQYYTYCFSGIGDLLSQWGDYADKVQRLSIGFTFSKMIDSYYIMFLYDVIYPHKPEEMEMDINSESSFEILSDTIFRSYKGFGLIDRED